MTPELSRQLALIVNNAPHTQEAWDARMWLIKHQNKLRILGDVPPKVMAALTPTDQVEVDGGPAQGQA